MPCPFASAEQGQFAEAIRIGEEALGFAESVDQPFSHILRLVLLWDSFICSGESYRKQFRLSERALELIRVWNRPMWFPWAAAQFGYALTLAGNLSEGMQFFEEALKNAVAIPFMIHYSLWLTWLGHAHLMAGRIQDAVECCRAGVKPLSRFGRTGIHGLDPTPSRRDCRPFGIRWRSRRPRVYYHQATTLAGELGMINFTA